MLKLVQKSQLRLVPPVMNSLYGVSRSLAKNTCSTMSAKSHHPDICADGMGYICPYSTG